jgi:predicted RNase H-like HicB family nuclease
MRYTVLLDWDAEVDEYAVSVPALPGCFTHGPTVAVATERVREAIEGYVAALVKLGEPVPVENPPLIAVAVEVEAPAGVLAAAG